MMASCCQPAVRPFYKEDNNPDSVIYLQNSSQESEGGREGGLGQRSAERIRLEKGKIMGRRGTWMGEVGLGIIVES